jgi:hypothetical protein
VGDGELPYAPIRSALRGLGVELADLGATDGGASADGAARVQMFELVLARLAAGRRSY